MAAKTVVMLRCFRERGNNSAPVLCTATHRIGVGNTFGVARGGLAPDSP
jgi:hypothetical protein